jgi:hypothetical protein
MPAATFSVTISRRTRITAAPCFVVPVPGRCDLRLREITGRKGHQVFCGYLSEGAHCPSIRTPAGSLIVRMAALRLRAAPTARERVGYTVRRTSPSH